MTFEIANRGKRRTAKRHSYSLPVSQPGNSETRQLGEEVVNEECALSLFRSALSPIGAARDHAEVRERISQLPALCSKSIEIGIERGGRWSEISAIT